jgi:hypothetical protein
LGASPIRSMQRVLTQTDAPFVATVYDKCSNIDRTDKDRSRETHLENSDDCKIF